MNIHKIDQRLHAAVFAGVLLFAAPASLFAQATAPAPTPPPAAAAPAAAAPPATADATPVKKTKKSKKAKAAETKAAAAAAAPASPPSATAPPPAPAVAGAPTFPSAVDSKYASQKAGDARMHTCLDQYHANKAANGNAGLKWIQKGGGYYSECSKKLKG